MTTPRGGRETLFRGDHLSVVARDRPAGPVFVTFNPLVGIAPNDAFWGESFLLQQGVSAIGIVCTGSDWFPPEEMRAAIDAVRRRTAGRRVLTYGFSRGGYGALKFSAALGAERAISFGPRFTDLVRAGNQGGDAHVDREDIAPEDLCACSHVFFDPLDARDLHATDRVHACATAAGLRVEKIPMPFASHLSLMVLLEGGTAPEMIRQFASDTANERSLRALVRQARRTSETYHLNRLIWLLDRRHRGGLRLLSRAMPSMPSGAARAFAEMSLLIAAGNHDDAASRLARVADAVLMSAFKLHWCWRYFNETRFLAGIRRIAPLLKAAMPRDLNARVHLAISYVAMGARESVAREFDELLAMDGIDRLRGEMSTLAAWLGRPDPFADVVLPGDPARQSSH